MKLKLIKIVIVFWSCIFGFFLVWTIIEKPIALNFGVKTKGKIIERRIWSEWGYQFRYIYYVDSKKYQSMNPYDCDLEPIISDSCDVYYLPSFPIIEYAKYNSIESGCGE